MNAYIGLKTKSWMNRETLFHGLSFRGHNPIIWDETQPIPVEYDAIYYGNVGYMDKVVKALGYHHRHIGHVPDDLLPLAGRKIEINTFDSVLEKKQPVFIKPLPHLNKQFTGFVYTGKQLQHIVMANYFQSGEKVITSEVVDFVSEWRCYICDGEVLDGKHYKGDFRIAPDYKVADEACKLWKDAPAAWSCDLGVTKDGRTLIVECNDCMCLGMYGLSELKAALMLDRRWEEIHFNKSL